MNKEYRSSCVLYVTATCNLACKYCYIDKTPILKEIDQLLTNSYKDDYYFNFMKEMFNQEKLDSIEFWGGEPSYGLERAIPTIKKAIKYFPNLRNFMFSTNLTANNCVENIINFYKQIITFDNRKFIFDLQLSLDGPPEINDYNRGNGTTKKFSENFAKLVYEINKNFSNNQNIQINSHFKPTLDSKNIKDLQTEEKVYNYFSFLETYKFIFEKYNYLNNFTFNPGLPNTATPSPHTTEEGKEFANFCKLINKIKYESKYHFKFYKDIMPFYSFSCYKKNYETLYHGYGTCGTGKEILGLLPNNLISVCHNGFVELIKDFKENIKNNNSILINNFFNFTTQKKNYLILTKDEYKTYEKEMEAFYQPKAKFQITEMASLIRQMAELGQIDEKYSNNKEAVKAAQFIQDSTCSCMRDNLACTGSHYLFQLGLIRLFLNGAREEILRYYDIPTTK